jgi:hypothetical protein
MALVTKEALLKHVSIGPLVTFRICFGILMMISTARFVALGWIEDHYTDPLFHFKYYGFSWVEPLPVAAMYALHGLLFLAALGLTLGLFYRWCALLVFLLFTYFELIDLSYYLNHYYFVSLVSAWLVVLPAHRYFSLDVLRKPELFRNHIPAFLHYILLFQITIVYLFAGLAKVNGVWLLDALPLKIWLPAQDNLPVIGPLLALPITAYVFSWIGMLYDVSIAFFLMWPKTRPWAYISVVIFHVLTGILFQIGVFPLVMMAAALLFFSPSWHLRLHRLIAMILDKRQLPFLQKEEVLALSYTHFKLKLYAVCISTYALFQLLFPWRFALYSGSMYWTEQGYRFGWRVMLMEKAGTATFYIRDGEHGREGVVFNADYLNPHQEKQMAMQPDFIVQFAHHLGEGAKAKGMKDPRVRAEVYVTLNGNPSRLLFSDTLNLLSVNDTWAPKKWLTPYE